MSDPITELTPAAHERALIDEALRQVESSCAGADLQGPLDEIAGFDILREIHRGGQGVVYLAIQRATKRRVAVKVLHTTTGEGSSAHARFEREVQILGRLEHPNIVRIHDSGRTGAGAFYYVMEYISGRSLDELIRDDVGSVRDRLTLFRQICDAVGAAHVRGIIHRDLKPANVRINQSGEPVVVDFGLAKVTLAGLPTEDTPQPMSMTGQFIGSLPWASPEQAAGSPNDIDVRTDVYSLGVILYQMLTGGEFPYEVVGNMRQILDNIARTEPSRPSTIRKQVDDEVETIVLKALSKEKDRRYQSAGELARDVDHYLRGQPIEAKRDSGWYVLSKTLRRYRPQVAVAITLLVLLAAFASVTTLMAREQSRLRGVAEDRAAESGVAEAAALTAGALAEDRRRLAEHNLDALRRFTGTLINDIYDELGQTRGTLDARARIIDGALIYLDAVDAADNPSLRAEVAAVCIRVGDLAGGRAAQQIGDTERARAVYQRALDLNGQRVNDDPTDPIAHADLADAIQRSAWLKLGDRDFTGAFATYQNAFTTFEHALDLATDDETRDSIERRLALATEESVHILHQAALTTRDGDVQRRLLDTALSRSDRAGLQLAKFPDDPVARQRLGALRLARVDLLVTDARWINGGADQLAHEGRMAEAEAEYRNAIEIFDRAVELAAENVADADLRMQHSTLAGDLRLRYGALHGAGLASMWKARTLEKLDRAAPADANARRIARLHGEALRFYEAARSDAERLLVEDETNLSATQDLAVALNKIANQHESLAQFDLALEAHTASSRIRERLASGDPTNSHRMLVAVALLKGSLVRMRIASESPNARPLWERSALDLAEALRIFDDVAPNSRYSDRARSALTTCEDALGRP